MLRSAERLKFLDIEKSVVTADAMSGQSEIVKAMGKGKADYVIAAKSKSSTGWTARSG
ncbi:MAG: hypothetical protein IJK52_12920 [Oscillospiraceae bacterium]|nr:hypothetical protein [Oscillospiraceae bacterium]